MDQLFALMKIFKDNLILENNMIIIKHDRKIYEIDKDTLKIRNPCRDYIDVNDYIANDIMNISKSNEISDKFGISEKSLVKITEKEFYDWLNLNNIKKIKKENELMTGRVIWLNKLNNRDFE